MNRKLQDSLFSSTLIRKQVNITLFILFKNLENVDDETRISEMTNFEELDKDKDGKLTPDELRPWALPDNEDVAKEEAEHLLNMCDLNRDGKLSIEEIVNKEEEFIGSSATDYGRTLHFVRDEL